MNTKTTNSNPYIERFKIFLVFVFVWLFFILLSMFFMLEELSSREWCIFKTTATIIENKTIIKEGGAFALDTTNHWIKVKYTFLGKTYEAVPINTNAYYEEYNIGDQVTIYIDLFKHNRVAFGYESDISNIESIVIQILLGLEVFNLLLLIIDFIRLSLKKDPLMVVIKLNKKKKS